jgi:hypothetical protein
MKENNPGGNATDKQIYQIDAITGEVIKEWKSSRQAGIDLEIKSWRNISVAVRKYKYQTVGGFIGDWLVIWMY